MGRLLLFAAAACFLASLAVALGATLGGSTWQQWLSGGLLAWLLALILASVPERTG